MHLPAGAAAETGRMGQSGLVIQSHRVWGKLLAFYSKSVCERQKFVRGYRVCRGTGSVMIHREQSSGRLFTLSSLSLIHL